MKNRYFKITFSASDPVSKELKMHTPVILSNSKEDAIDECENQIKLYGFFKDYKIVDVVEL